ncbi:hypothetical protein [Streptomyces niveus]|uniref:hypothetical protein n=1 Tax=Streptomyces niveus TaxID=193462 RepID=UPI00084BE7CA|nr:hypothetical protein [Streptomyces niveus]
MSTDSLTRRGYLAAAIRADGRPVTTEHAVQLLDGSPYAAGRNTVRKQLGGLAKDGALTSTDINGRRVYVPNTPEGSA